MKFLVEIALLFRKSFKTLALLKIDSVTDSVTTIYSKGLRLY